MNKWLKKINIKPALEAFDEKYASTTQKTEHLQEIKDLLALKLGHAGGTFDDLIRDLKHVHTVDEFDAWLNSVYDRADGEQVWLGL